GGFALIGEDGSDWSRELIDLAGIDAFDLDVRFSASRVIVRKTELSRVAATATMRNGALAVSVGEAQFHGGALRGQALLGRNANGDAHVKLEGNVTNFDLGPGISALTGVQRLEGKGN